MAIVFEVTSYPERPCDFALFGALEWLASEHAGEPVYLRDMYTLQRACELAGLAVPDLLGMVARGHLRIEWAVDN
jgi:hypothetical protein